MGLFIEIRVDERAGADAALAAELEEACPVDIFRAAGGVSIVEDNADECILCGLCVDAAPPGAVQVVRRYGDGAVMVREG